MNFCQLRELGASGKEDITISCLQSELNALNIAFLIDVFFNLCSYLVLYILGGYKSEILSPDVLFLDVFLLFSKFIKTFISLDLINVKDSHNFYVGVSKP